MIVVAVVVVIGKSNYYYIGIVEGVGEGNY